jgi:hypothetical protein
MKKKIIVLWILTAILTSITLSPVSADYSESSEEWREHHKKWNSEKREEMRHMRWDRNEFMKWKKWDFHKFRWLNAEHRKEMEALFNVLPEETKSKLEALKETHKQEIKILHDTIKENKPDAEKKEAFLSQMKILRENHLAQVKEIVWTESEIVKKMEEKYVKFEERKAMKYERKKKRQEFREQKSEIISKYKGQFLGKIWDKISKMSDERLEKLSQKLSKIYTRTESNTQISDDKKETILVKIVALQELIDSQQKSNGLNVDELLN